jgi:exonuclease I
MFRRKKKQPEHLPWYRARNYKGNLTEDEKRQLDFFRMQKSILLPTTTAFRKK